MNLDMGSHNRHNFTQFIWASVVLLSFTLVTSCSPNKEALPELDKEAFRRDRKGCGGVRYQMLYYIKQNQESLLGLSEYEINSLLGPSDIMDLGKRSQKQHIYYLSAGRQCTPDSTNEGWKLKVRINATNTVTETVVTQFD